MHIILLIEVHLFTSAHSWWFFYDERPPGKHYFWPEQDPLFDCVTPIAYWSRPINSGIFIRPDLIVTSEIALESYFKYPSWLNIYVPSGAFYLSVECSVYNTIGDIWGKTYFWVYWGGWRTYHNPVHDIMFLHVRLDQRYNKILVLDSPHPVNRRPYYVPVASKHQIEEPSGWRTGAFALTDRFHVNDSSRFVPLYYDEPVLVDCDEYFPRFWGYFICIVNLEKYPVIQSGAPLIQNGRLFGVASFTFRRGKENIYAFTDLRPYRDMIDGIPAIIYGRTSLFIKIYLLGNVFVRGWNGDRYAAGIKFYWSKDDPSFDCVTPIGARTDRINLGVFIRPNLVVTSAVPIAFYFPFPHLLKVYIIGGTYATTVECSVRNSIGDVLGKGKVYWGGNRTENSPVHDLMFLHVIEKWGLHNSTIEVFDKPNTQNRRPYFLPVADAKEIEEPSGWRSGAFALTDRFHVNDSSIFIPLYYDDPVLVDCDEYFPRFWGYFICILNIDKYPVIQSGAPLIQNGRVFGVASFTLRRGKESIYAFTDLRAYRDIIDSIPPIFYR